MPTTPKLIRRVFTSFTPHPHPLHHQTLGFCFLKMVQIEDHDHDGTSSVQQYNGNHRVTCCECGPCPQLNDTKSNCGTGRTGGLGTSCFPFKVLRQDCSVLRRRWGGGRLRTSIYSLRGASSTVVQSNRIQCNSSTVLPDSPEI